MKVRVKLFASLGSFSPQGGLPGTPFELELPLGATLHDLMQHLQLPVEQIKVCFVNSRIQPPNYILNEGDNVGIFPPVGGGSHV
ncbi:MAG: MoaD/ThiS family protein [Anaerolineales bacterium]|jgi:molybdopterin converting factor small subunit